MNGDKRRFTPELVLRIILLILFAYFFFGFMLVPCLNTLTSIFNERTNGVRDPLNSSWRAACPGSCGTP